MSTWPYDYQNAAMYGLHGYAQLAAAQMPPMLPGTSGFSNNNAVTEPSRKRRFDYTAKVKLRAEGVSRNRNRLWYSVFLIGLEVLNFKGNLKSKYINLNIQKNL